MKELLKRLLTRLLLAFYRIRSLKYVAVCLLAVLAIGIFDENSAYSHVRNKGRIARLQAEIDDLRRHYISDSLQIQYMQTDLRAVERVARERYYMKRPNEEIFVFKGDDQRQTIYTDETFE